MYDACNAAPWQIVAKQAAHPQKVTHSIPAWAQEGRTLGQNLVVKLVGMNRNSS
jgi:hypothetical protein